MKPKFHCIDSENFRFKGEMVCAFTYKNYEISPHDHDFYEMNIVLSGEGIHKLGDASIKVCAGDVFVIPPGMVHAYEQCNKLDVFHILIRRKFIEQNKNETQSVKGFVQLMEIEPFVRGNLSKKIFVHLSPASLLNLKRDLEFIEELYYRNEKEFEPLKQHTTWKILYYLSDFMYRQIHETDKKTNNENTIMEILEYMHTCYGDKITVDTLCEKFFISRSSLMRKFNSICKSSPMEYLMGCRKKAAMELIDNGVLSKTEIAHICGFYDLSHMKKVIKKED